MKSKRETINIDTNWTELEENFDILSYGLFSENNFEVQEYGISGWSSSITIPANKAFFKNTSIQKIRVRSLSGTISINYSLSGFIAYRVEGEDVSSALGVNLDGGSSSEAYLSTQNLDGGSANEVYSTSQTLDGGSA